MPPLRTQIIPEAIYPAGTRSGTFNVPTGVTQITWSATRVNWPDTGEVILHLGADLSLDNGQTWMYWLGFGAMGGDVYGRLGLITESSGAREIPEPDNNHRRLRVTVRNTVELTTGIAITTG